MEDFKPMMKQIESLCKPLTKLGKNGVVKVEDIKNGYNKAPLAEVAFDLFKCLLDAKKLLVYQNEHIADVSVVVKDQKQKLVELDTSLVEAIEQSSKHNLMEEMLKGIEENKRAIADVKAELKQWWIQPDIHGGCRASEASPAGARRANMVRCSAPIELRQGSGGAAPGKFLGDYTLKSAFLQYIEFTFLLLSYNIELL